MEDSLGGMGEAEATELPIPKCARTGPDFSFKSKELDAARSSLGSVAGLLQSKIDSFSQREGTSLLGAKSSLGSGTSFGPSLRKSASDTNLRNTRSRPYSGDG